MALMLLPKNATEDEEHAVRCDAPGCDLEISAPTEDEVLEAAALAGFKLKQDAGRWLAMCPECQQGRNPALNQAVAAHAQPYEPEPAAGGGDPTGWLN